VHQVANIIKSIEEQQSGSGDCLKSTIQQIMLAGATPATTITSPQYFTNHSKCSLKTLPLSFD